MRRLLTTVLLPLTVSSTLLASATWAAAPAGDAAAQQPAAPAADQANDNKGNAPAAPADAPAAPANGAAAAAPAERPSGTRTTDTPYPEPSPYPVSWDLDFSYGTPRRIVVNVPGMGEPRAYWYLPYKVTNNSDKEVYFLPRFELIDRDGNIHRSDHHIPGEVFTAIKRREGNKYLVAPTAVRGQLRLGEDQARESVAIWEEPTRRMGAFTIYVTGLSGEFVEMKGPDGKPLDDGKGNPIILRKTLQLKFHINGDEVYPGEDVVNPGENPAGAREAKRWVMR